MRCSKGTYIRTLVEDLAAKAGTVAYTQHLHRESVGCFDAEAMVDMSVIERAEAPAEVRQWLISPDQALLSLGQAHLSRDAADRFCGGQSVPAETTASGLVRVYREDDLFLGVGELADNGMLAPLAAREAVDVVELDGQSFVGFEAGFLLPVTAGRVEGILGEVAGLRELYPSLFAETPVGA